MDRPDLVSQIPGLRRYARALTGDAWAADDLVQDTLERACSKWRLWSIGSDLRAWLFTIMHNVYVSDVRQIVRQRRAGTSHNLDDVAHELIAPDMAQDATIDLQRCLLQLPEEQRGVLLLASVEDMDYATIARVTGVPVGTVMSRLSRARTRLQALLDTPTKTLAQERGSSVIPLRRPS